MMEWFPGAGGGRDPELELTFYHKREISWNLLPGVQGAEVTGTLAGRGAAAEIQVRDPKGSCTPPQRDAALAHGSKFGEQVGKLW